MSAKKAFPKDQYKEASPETARYVVGQVIGSDFYPCGYYSSHAIATWHAQDLRALDLRNHPNAPTLRRDVRVYEVGAGLKRVVTFKIDGEDN